MNNFLNLNRIEKNLNKLVYKNDPIKENFRWNGLPIAIEWRKGETRQYENDPNNYKNLMHADYGYIKGTDSQDGEELDVYIKSESNKKTCFMVSQLDSKKGTFDEFKYMLGFDNEKEAEKCYTDTMPKNMFGGISEIEWSRFMKEHFKFYKNDELEKIEKSLNKIICKDIYSDNIDLKKLVSEVSDLELGMGIKHEMEHSENPMDALKIALDHLSEKKDYYEKLQKLGL